MAGLGVEGDDEAVAREAEGVLVGGKYDEGVEDGGGAVGDGAAEGGEAGAFEPGKRGAARWHRVDAHQVEGEEA